MSGKLLLIGGGGYIGTVVADQLLRDKYDLTILDNFIYNHKDSINNLKKFDNFKLIEGDIINKDFLYEKIKNYDCVVLLAGLVGDPITKKYPNLSNEINDFGIKNAIDATFKNKIKKFIFISTCSNYGLIKSDDLADENHSLAPLSLYAKNKVKAEKYIMNYKNESSDTSTTILRFATAFGLSYRMRFDLTVNEFVKILNDGKELSVYDADTWRPYCHVKDFARLIKKVIEIQNNKTSFQIFNSGGNNNNFTKRMIVNELLKFYKNPLIKFLDKGPDPRNYKVNFSRVKETFNFIPKYTLEDGILEIKDYLKSKKNNFTDCGNYLIDNEK
tara:strand:+ start:597 stop:1586 length:990 start_codon:yes stop_codon:yes gene_type:complete